MNYMKTLTKVVRNIMAATCIAAGGILPSIPAAAQTSQRLDAGKASEYGLVYSLPLTVLDIVLEAELTEENPGEFQNYARRYLGVEDAVRTPSRSASLKSAVVLTRGVADSGNRWLAQFKAGSTPFMILNADNVPVAINTEDVPAVEEPALPQAKDAAPNPLQTEAARQAVTQDMARSSSVSKKAELASQRIFELRETRSDILSGQSDNTPPDGQAMKLVLDNLSAQEAALTAMFAGTRSTRTVVTRVTLEPDSTDISGKVIARLSSVDGFVDADNLSGAPVTVNVTVLDEGRLPVNEKGEVKRFPKGGVAYTIPGTALVEVCFDGRTVASVEVPLAQLGVTFGLDPALFTDKKSPSKVIFDSATGAVVTLGPAN